MKERIDIWLWHARFFKTRSLATKMVKSKKIRINGTVVSKASSPVTIGDVLTFVKAGDVRVIEIKAQSERRGPYSEAITLYKDMSPEPLSKQEADLTRAPAREKGMGRPTKKDRRAFNHLTENDEF